MTFLDTVFFGFVSVMSICCGSMEDQDFGDMPRRGIDDAARRSSIDPVYVHLALIPSNAPLEQNELLPVFLTDVAGLDKYRGIRGFKLSDFRQ